MDFDDLKWQSPKALRGKDPDFIVAPELLDLGGHFLVADFTQTVDDGEPGPSRWSFVPEEAYQRPPQLLAAQLIQPKAGMVWLGRFCGHRVKIMVNRGEAFCCEACRKDFERFSDRVKSRIARSALHERYADAAEIFQTAQRRLRAREQKASE